MMIKLTPERMQALQKWIAAPDEAEQIGDNEYIWDLFDDMEPPLTLDCLVLPAGINVLAAATLSYDEEQDGYYMNERIEDAAALRALLEPWLDSHPTP